MHKENKNNDFIQQFFSSESLLRIHESITTHAFGAAADVEFGCAEPCFHSEECTCMHRGTLVNAHRRLTQKRGNSCHFCFLCAQKVFP